MSGMDSRLVADIHESLLLHSDRPHAQVLTYAPPHADPHIRWAKRREDQMVAAEWVDTYTTDPVIRAVLDLHQNDDGVCLGCDGYDDPEWPCRTWDTIAEAM